MNVQTAGMLGGVIAGFLAGIFSLTRDGSKASAEVVGDAIGIALILCGVAGWLVGNLAAGGSSGEPGAAFLGGAVGGGALGFLMHKKTGPGRR